MPATLMDVSNVQQERLNIFKIQISVFRFALRDFMPTRRQKVVCNAQPLV